MNSYKPSLKQLQQEAAQAGADWGMVFAAALSSMPGRTPSSQDTEQPLQATVEAIREGHIQSYIPFDTQGRAVRLG